MTFILWVGSITTSSLGSDFSSVIKFVFLFSTEAQQSMKWFYISSLDFTFGKMAFWKNGSGMYEIEDRFLIELNEIYFYFSIKFKFSISYCCSKTKWWYRVCRVGFKMCWDILGYLSNFRVHFMRWCPF